MNGGSHRTMKIIKPRNFKEETPPQGFSEARRGSAVTLIRHGGAPSGAAGFIANNKEI
jgi:hypothetical protein